jgi:hypothetical protein
MNLHALQTAAAVLCVEIAVSPLSHDPAGMMISFLNGSSWKVGTRKTNWVDLSVYVMATCVLVKERRK